MTALPGSYAWRWLPHYVAPDGIAGPTDPVPFRCPACGSLRTRIIEVDVTTRKATLECLDCGTISVGVSY